MTETHYCKRLIEVDLPIQAISAHARREKSIRDGHISTLHAWWARRPLAACRAVVLASVLPDPADPLCPASFAAVAKETLATYYTRKTGREPSLKTKAELRDQLLRFIGDTSQWELSTDVDALKAMRRLVAYDGHRPLVLDPFAGGGSIPLEALRVGADVVASDLNPLPVLLNRVLVEYIPRYGSSLADDLLTLAERVRASTDKRIAQYYDSKGTAPIVAYLWAREVRCEGPGCGARVPLIRSLQLASRGRQSVGLRLSPTQKPAGVDVSIVTASSFPRGTVRRGAMTCPVCGYTTPAPRLREQLISQSGGADSSRLLAVVRRSRSGKTYHVPDDADRKAVAATRKAFRRDDSPLAVELPLMSGVFNAPLWGMTRWDLLYSSRQMVTATVLGEEIDTAVGEFTRRNTADRAIAAKVLLLLARGKYLDFRSSLCGWISVGEKIGHTFGRQALGMIFDWVEGTPFGDMSGSWERSTEAIATLIRREAAALPESGSAIQADATNHPLPDDSVAAVITDPPYYNAVPYADLSDFFYLWLRPHLAVEFPELFATVTAPKAAELCEMSGWDPVRYPNKDAKFFESGMLGALREARRICRPDGIAVVVFAHKTTSGWESLLGALVGAGWVVTASWPIDTERAGRLRAMNSAALASSVHLVCRPREDSRGEVLENVGEWSAVLRQLPKRIGEWLPRLAAEGVVGADAIFACLGPALEVFSKYARVEKASGDVVTLNEYLEHVWAAVAKQALSMVLDGAETMGLEPDGRLTAIWLWTIGGSSTDESGDAEDASSDEEEVSGGPSAGGFALEYDAARKLAQGLGAHLEELGRLVEVRGKAARLLSVEERARYLFANSEGEVSSRKRKKAQASLFTNFDLTEAVNAHTASSLAEAKTTLDRVHQAMLLFGGGRGEALKRFLVEEGVGAQPQFWKLAQSLSALYPAGTSEKRWVDGVLARKKSFGFA